MLRSILYKATIFSPLMYSILAVTLAIVVFVPLAAANEISDGLASAVIASVSVVTSVLGGLEANRRKTVREQKREYYHKLLEAFADRIAWMSEEYNEKNREQGWQVVQRFCVEVNRLKLYASEEVVKFMEDAVNDPNKGDYSTLYELIRDDLVNERFRPFYDLPKEMKFHFFKRQSSR